MNETLYYSWFSKRIYLYVTTIQGWLQQPSLVELENYDEDKEKKDDVSSKSKSSLNNDAIHKKINCYRCDKLDHIKKNYVKIKGENIINKNIIRMLLKKIEINILWLKLLRHWNQSTFCMTR